MSIAAPPRTSTPDDRRVQAARLLRSELTLGEYLGISEQALHRYAELAWRRLEAGRFAEALPLTRGLVATQPLHAGRWALHGAVLMGLGRHVEALAAFERAVLADGSCVDGWAGKGELLLHLGRRDEGLDALERAAALDPGGHLRSVQRARSLLAAVRGSTPPR